MRVNLSLGVNGNSSYERKNFHSQKIHPRNIQISNKSFNNYKQNDSVSFGRALVEGDETVDYNKTLRESLEYAGVKQNVLILHGSSFPIGNNDLYIGSPFGEEAKKLHKFAKLHGYTGIQLGPPGEISVDNPSPYASSVFTKNYLFSDMPKLTKDEYANILSMSDIEKENSMIYENNSSCTDFKKAKNAYDSLFEKAYENLMTKDTPESIALKESFNEFKANANKNLENVAIFEVLKKKYNTGNFEKWPNLANNLILYSEDEKHPLNGKAKLALKGLKKDYAKEIDLYKFKQYIVDRHEKEFIETKPERLDYSTDVLVGFSKPDVWANKGVFLPKKYAMGCPYGGAGFAKNGSPWGNNQMWGDVPVINPKTIFNKDGSLGKGGLFLKDKYSYMLGRNQNMRIDFVLGTIDPWIYNKEKVEIVKNEAGEVVYTNAHGANVSQMGKKDAYPIHDWMDEQTKQVYMQINKDIEKMPNLDPDRNFSRVLEEIVLPTLREKGVNIENLVLEDLCTPSDKFNEIYHTKLNMQGITDLKGQQGENKSRRNWFLLTSHDTPPMTQIATDEYFRSNSYKGGAMQPDYLIGFLHPEKTNLDRDALIGKLNWNTRHRVITKYQELYKCGEKIQTAFMDFFGLDKTYNRAGQQHPDNWKLRLPKNYQQEYYQNIANKDWKKMALNMPEILERVVASKANLFGETEKMKPLIDKLKHYKDVLYTPDVTTIAEKAAKTITKVA